MMPIGNRDSCSRALACFEISDLRSQISDFRSETRRPISISRTKDPFSWVFQTSDLKPGDQSQSRALKRLFSCGNSAAKFFKCLKQDPKKSCASSKVATAGGAIGGRAG